MERNAEREAVVSVTLCSNGSRVSCLNFTSVSLYLGQAINPLPHRSEAGAACKPALNASSPPTRTGGSRSRELK